MRACSRRRNCRWIRRSATTPATAVSQRAGCSAASSVPRADWRNWLPSTTNSRQQARRWSSPSWVEAALGDGWEVEVEEIMEVLDEDAAAVDGKSRQRCGQSGFKLRCGGLEAAAFPTAEQIAWALVNAQDREVPMKFTAGLHHPLRRFDAGVQGPMHGFLNVLLAGVFAGVETVDEDDLLPILLN